MMSYVRLSGIMCAVLFLSCTRTDRHTLAQRTPGVLADSGMVVCAHPEAARVGVEILRKGGNAVDAAIAVQFALAVVYPEAGNIAGGGFMVVRLKSGEINSLDFREKAPLRASRDMYLDKDGNVVPNASTEGVRASGVPGSVDGMIRAHAKYGSLPWKDLLQPAIDLASHGFPVTARQARDLNVARGLFLQWNDSSSSLPFVKRDTAGWKAGDTLVQTELARTLELIRDRGREGFYAGETAANIVRQMEQQGGLISSADLEGYESKWREPIVGWYRGCKIISMPPPSSGGIALMQLLKMVERFNVRSLGFNSDASIHLLAEAEKRVYADRATYLGDGDFVRIPARALMDSQYLATRMGNFNPGKATPSMEIASGKFTSDERMQTTHFSIVDKWRNAVAVTTTLNEMFGSCVVVPGSGFLLNNEMDDFSVKPGVPNIYGLIGGDANAIAPEKRMLSSMTPTILERDGRLSMILGSPGGSTIITTVFQCILDVVDYGMTMQGAVSAKRFHCQWLPDTIQIEHGAVDSLTILRLEQLGQHVATIESIGRIDAILASPDGKLEGGADPRGDDAAAGY